MPTASGSVAEYSWQRRGVSVVVDRHMQSKRETYLEYRVAQLLYDLLHRGPTRGQQTAGGCHAY